MKLQDYSFSIGVRSDPSLLDFLSDVTTILNNGRYQMRIVSVVPNWVGDDGEHLLYVNGTTVSLYVYSAANATWEHIDWVQGGANPILVGSKRGDIYYIDQDINGNLFVNRLGIGPASYILTSSGQVPFWSAPPSGVFNIAVVLSLGAGLSIISMNETATKVVTMTTSNSDTPNNENSTMATIITAGKPTMNETTSKTSAIATSFTSAVA